MLAEQPPAGPTRTRFRERIVTELSPPPEASSSARPWAGMTVQLHDWHAAGSVASPVVDHDILAMRYTGRVRLEQRRVGKVHRALVVPGNVTIHPRGFESSWNWDRPGAIVLARIPQYVLVEAADATVRRAAAQIELRNCFGARDDFVQPVMNLLAREVQQPAHPVQELIAESMSCALAGHLVQRFNVQRVTSLSDPAGLDPRALRRVLDFIHAQPAGSIRLKQLAEIAGVSRFHFARMFRRSTGDSPIAYLERARISHAQELIRSGHYKLAEIAARVGFADQAHFTRRFRRAVGCTPAVYARHHAATFVIRDASGQES
jgi:AraC family transcriptional regulator